jgi:hypothetical protein
VGSLECRDSVCIPKWAESGGPRTESRQLTSQKELLATRSKAE